MRLDGFFTIEGPNGSGKTTLVQKLVNRLTNEYEEDQIVATRSFHLDGTLEEVRESNALEDQLAIAAFDRAVHTRNVIAPAIMEGRLVVSDRYIDSTIVYQLLLRGHPVEPYLHLVAPEGIAIPEATLVLMNPPELCAERIAQRGGKPDLSFLRREYEAYEQLIELFPRRVFPIYSTDDAYWFIRRAFADKNLRRRSCRKKETISSGSERS